ncbi:MAG: hypothetical protein AB7F76_00175 [Parvibaculaceae bacterium]
MSRPYHIRPPARSRALDSAEKDAEEAFLLGLAGLLFLVLTVLVWSILHS